MLSRNVPFLVPTLVVAAALVAVLVGLLLPRWVRGDRDGAVRLGSSILLVATLILIVVVTLVIVEPLVGFDDSGHQGLIYSANLTPFEEIRAQLDHPDPMTGFVNVVGNVLLFAPVGCFGLLLTRWRFLAIVVSGAALSIVIETTQYFTHRIADIDDVILNLTGTAVGALFALAFQRVLLNRSPVPSPGPLAASTDRG